MSTKRKMTDKQFKERAAELLREERKQPVSWWYLSFADQVFHGAVIIAAHGLTDAVRTCHALNINPGGQVLGAPLPPEILAQVPQADRERLLTREDVTRIWADAKSIREHEADVRA